MSDIVTGWYNLSNKVFLGNMVATNEATGVASTPRYVEGCAMVKYNVRTNEVVEFITNPVIIPRGTIVEYNEQITDNGQNVLHVTGYEEDKGADLKSKGSIAGYTFKSSNVETRDEQGRVYDESKIVRTKNLNDEAQVVSAQSETKVTPKQDNQFTPKEDLPVIDWSKLF